MQTIFTVEAKSKQISYWHILAVFGSEEQAVNYKDTLAKSHNDTHEYRTTAWELRDNTLDEALTKAREDGITRGIAVAVGLLIKHNMSAENILSECGIADKKELRAAGVEQFDLDNIGDLLPEEAW